MSQETKTGGTLQVRVAYTGSGPVDDNHKIYVVLWDSATFVQEGSRLTPIQVMPIASKNAAAVFNVSVTPVYVSAVYDPTGQWMAEYVPPAGASLGLHSKSLGKPEPVTVNSGKVASVEMSFDDSTKAPQARTADPGWRAFLPQFEQAANRFVNGDPTAWKQNSSRRDDATIMGAWGAFEKGWSEVSARYDWAAARLLESGAKIEVEYLSSGVSGDLAYTVAIERSVARVIDQDKPSPMALRVTHIFRKENGTWKLLHRHADPIMTKTAPATVLRKE